MRNLLQLLRPALFLTLIGNAACSEPDCLDNERKIGVVCYPKGTKVAIDGSVVLPSDDDDVSGRITTDMDGGSPADAATDASTVAADAAKEPPVSDDSSVSAPPPPPPDPCPGSTINACGGCEVLDHKLGDACSNGGVGPCALPGSYQCLGDKLVCNAPPPTPQPEICDGMDNDCDGMTDDGVLNACGGCALLTFAKDAGCGAGVGECKVAGTYQCSNTEAVACSAVAKAPGVEACDGKDNDCNGMVDDGAKNECGMPCGSTCPPACVPTTEVCDGKDNNCNNQIDEGVTTMWSPDCDADSFGASTGSQQACAQPPPSGSCSFVKNAQDCLDTNSDYNPNAMFGVASSGPDRNCDGVVSFNTKILRVTCYTLGATASSSPVDVPVCTSDTQCDCIVKPTPDWAATDCSAGNEAAPMIYRITSSFSGACLVQNSSKTSCMGYLSCK